MTPVINPWVFYFMEMSTGLDVFCGVFGTICAVVFVVSIILYFCFVNDGDMADEVKVIKQILKTVGWAAGVLLFIGMIVPCQDTIIKMLIAENVTYEGVEVVANTVETVYNDIMELVKSK